MDGAFGLKKGLLHGDILLNLDSETEGELYVGCAGGLDANIVFKYAAEPTPARNYTAARITVKGLKGGHSGIQIVCQRANANKVLFRFLNAAFGGRRRPAQRHSPRSRGGRDGQNQGVRSFRQGAESL
jgi:dipeptidase D